MNLTPFLGMILFKWMYLLSWVLIFILWSTIAIPLMLGVNYVIDLDLKGSGFYFKKCVENLYIFTLILAAFCFVIFCIRAVWVLVEIFRDGVFKKLWIFELAITVSSLYLIIYSIFSIESS